MNSQMYNHGKRPPTKNYIIGVGGRDVRPKHIRGIFDDLEKVSKEGYGEEGEIHWWGLLDGKTPEEEL